MHQPLFTLDEACRQLADWRSRGHRPGDVTVSVDVSGRGLVDPGLVDPGLVDRVAAAVSRHGIPPERLCLEMTETALIGEVGEVGEVEEVLSRLSTLGVRLALDDLGTGCSTLVHLRHLRVDVRKIGRSFVEHIGRSARDREVVAAATAMSHALGLSVVGEGVATHHPHAELAPLACDDGQGFPLPTRSMPMPWPRRSTGDSSRARSTRASTGRPRAFASRLTGAEPLRAAETVPSGRPSRLRSWLRERAPVTAPGARTS